jgi:hypothetical protein
MGGSRPTARGRAFGSALHWIAAAHGLLAPARAQAPAEPGGGARDFPVFVWRPSDAVEDDAHLELLAPYGGIQVIAEDEAEWARAHELEFFVFNAPGRDILHLDPEDRGYRERWQAWFQGRDDVHLWREPCLTDPATRARLFEQLTRSLRARGGDFGRGISLGDEVSLTPYGAPEDVCLSPTCRRAWASFLAGREDLQPAEREALADPAVSSTDAARKALTEGDTGPLRGWLLRREFHQRVVVDLLAELARRARAEEPHAPVGLLGLAGQTAFGNVPVERVVPFLDFIECYPVGDARELAFTLRPARTSVWATVFPDSAQPNRAAWSAWSHWIRGGDGLVVWSERELAAYPHEAARLEATVARIRELRARFPEFRPEPRGVALVHSPRSLAVSWLRDALLDGPTWPKRLPGYQERHGTLEHSLDAWLRFFEDQGLMPGALPFEGVGAGTVERFPVLVLSHALSIDERELARLHEFLGAGGTLIVHGDVGWVDGRGARRERPLLEELLSASPRVLVAPEAIDGYPETRTRREAPERKLLELRLWSYLNAIKKGLDSAPFQVQGDHALELPWIKTWARHRESGGWVCAALPNAVGEVEQRRLEKEIPVAIAPLAGLRVEWVHPPGPPDPAGMVRLAPVDAAVFLLLPERPAGSR